MTPTLVMLIGLPGSGKTTLASWLGANSETVVVSRDAIRAAMFPQCRYTVDEKLAAFEAMKAAIGVTLGQARFVCTDGITFASRQDRLTMSAVAAARGARIQEVWCDVSVQLAQERVAADEVTVFPDRNPALVEEVAARFDDVSLGALRLDMSEPVGSIGRQLLTVLGAR